MTSKRATVTVPTFHLSEEVRDGKPKKYVVYHVVVKYPGQSAAGGPHTVYRRYTNFEEFHKAWGALYPQVAQAHPLPNNAILVLDNPKYLLMNTSEKAEARRVKLEQYLVETLAIDAILDFFVPFLEVEKSNLKKKIVAGMYCVLCVCVAVCLLYHTVSLALMSFFVVVFWFFLIIIIMIADEDLKPKPAIKKQEDDAKTTNGLRVITNAPDPNDPTLQVQKGNTHQANAKALRHRARFEKKLDALGVPIDDPTAPVTIQFTHADASTCVCLLVHCVCVDLVH